MIVTIIKNISYMNRQFIRLETDKLSVNLEQKHLDMFIPKE